MVTSKIQYLLLKYGFNLLYHSQAWTYDWVADVASAGQWKTWIGTALPLVQGPRVLELGMGPGHFQASLLEHHFAAFGIDESRQMVSISRRNIRHRMKQNQGVHRSCRLVRGKAQFLPYPNNAFNTVISTFPSPYIFDPLTTAEIVRVLAPEGIVIIVLGAEIIGHRPAEILARWLMKVTHQSIQDQGELEVPEFPSLMQLYTQEVSLKSSRVLLLQAKKTESGENQLIIS